MTVFHISDLKKYNRCARLFALDQADQNKTNHQYVRVDEEITPLVCQYLGITDCFLGQKGDDATLALDAIKDHEWLVKARFVYGDLRIKVPFLHKVEKGFDLYFMFVGIHPRNDDISYYCAIYWVLENLDIHINHAYIIYLNENYQRQGDIDTKSLFSITDKFFNQNNNPTIDIIPELQRRLKDPTQSLLDMQTLTIENMPKAIRTSRCTGRNKCKYYDQCFPEEMLLPANSILTLSSAKNKYEMYAQGIRYLKDADIDQIEANRVQYAQICADRNGGLYVDHLGLSHWLSLIKYPISFLDFEWERFAIPPYDGMHPYDVLPFEYSLHILYEDGHTDHKVFLSKHDDREAMIQSLLTDIPQTGSVIAYNAEGAEKLRLQELSEQIPQYANALMNIYNRMEDMQLPFASGTVYDTRMAGQWGLKKIMSMMNDKSYQDLEINQGMDAVFAWRQLDYDEDIDNEEEIINDLKKYCGMDSYAMVIIYQWLKRIV